MILTENAIRFPQVLPVTRYLHGIKGYIVGGCFKDIFQGRTPKDIDIFFPNEEEYDRAVIHFREQFYETKILEKNAFFMDHQTNTRIELCKQIVGPVDALLNQFDFTVTRFAVVDSLGGEGTAKDMVAYFGDRYFQDLMTKTLVVDHELVNPIRTLKRMLRYSEYGFHANWKSIRKVARALNTMDPGMIHEEAQDPDASF
jgi:hypothetical protein